MSYTKNFFKKIEFHRDLILPLFTIIFMISYESLIIIFYNYSIPNFFEFVGITFTALLLIPLIFLLIIYFIGLIINLLINIYKIANK